MLEYQELPKLVGKTITLLGWIRKLRQGKKISFISLCFKSDSVQVVAPSSTLPEGYLIEAFVQVTGTVGLLPEGAYSDLPVEIQATEIKVLGPSDPSYLTQCPPEASATVKLEKRHLYFRDPHFALITKLRAQLLQAMRAHFDASGCTEIVPPCFTGVECEGGSTLFKLPYPGKSKDSPITAYLTQSSQFALEFCLPGLGDVYCIYPSFRAEHSHTRRHLTEFLHAEAEWAGVLTFEDHLQHLRDLLEGILRHLLIIGEKTLKALKIYERVQGLYEMTKDIMVLDHKDAIQECTKRGIFKDETTKEPFGPRDDIPEAQERQLIDSIGKIVFLCRFPKEFKSFYMALDPEDPSLALGVDIEVPSVGEISGSSMREHDYERFKHRLLEAGLKPEDYEELLALRRFGFSKSSGMGLGVDRMLTWITGSHSIRDVVSFPRVPDLLRP